MNVPLVLGILCNGQPWRLADVPKDAEEYEAFLEWFGDGTPPTWDDILSASSGIEYQQQYDAVTVARQTGYQQTSDPIFMQYQRGEATEKEWLDAVEAVKDANPYPVRAS